MNHSPLRTGLLISRNQQEYVSFFNSSTTKIKIESLQVYLFTGSFHCGLEAVVISLKVFYWVESKIKARLNVFYFRVKCDEGEPIRGEGG